MTAAVKNKNKLCSWIYRLIYLLELHQPLAPSLSSQWCRTSLLHLCTLLLYQGSLPELAQPPNFGKNKVLNATQWLPVCVFGPCFSLRNSSAFLSYPFFSARGKVCMDMTKQTKLVQFQQGIPVHSRMLWVYFLLQVSSLWGWMFEGWGMLLACPVISMRRGFGHDEILKVACSLNVTRLKVHLPGYLRKCEIRSAQEDHWMMPLLLCEWLEPMVALWVTFSHLISLRSCGHRVKSWGKRLGFSEAGRHSPCLPWGDSPGRKWEVSKVKVSLMG